MRKVLTARQMREVDRLTTEKYGVPSLLLMENAAQAVARVILEDLGGTLHGKSILILCGKGNNGGDGAALARIAHLAGAHIEIFLFGKITDSKGDARVNFDAASQIVGAIHEMEEGDNWDDLVSLTRQKWDGVVDALFGTGLTRQLDPWLSSVVGHINSLRQQPTPPLMVSIDVPSGLNADAADLPDNVVKADLTVTFTAPKAANVLAPAVGANGRLHIQNIGSPAELIEASESELYVTERSDAAKWLSATGFSNNSYKNKRGHALIIAGSKNYTGAAVLCGDAAIRSGVGLVTLAVPEGSKESVVARVSPEVMVRGISQTEAGSAARSAAAEVADFLENIDVVAVGSGLSVKEDETREFIKEIVATRRTPVVIDADGLTALSPFLIKGTSELPLILTPHEGEFMRLLATDDKSVIKDRVRAVRDFATMHNVILVLKGERALIGEPGGRVLVNPTGNSGLGKAGNGDTLTGIIAGFLGQAIQMKIDVFDTVVAAVYLSGLAGDIAAAKFGKRVMTASDVRESLVEAFEQAAA